MGGYVCIAVPHFIGELLPGRTEIAALKDSGIADELGAAWADINPDFDSAEHPAVAVNRALAETIRTHPDQTPLIFAADCVSALGALKGLEAQQPDVLWYDAHGDFNTWETTPSGFLGGMPLAMLVGRGDMQFMRGIGLAPLDEECILITDARDLDPEEEVALRESKLTHLKQVSDLQTATLPGGPSASQVMETLKRVVAERPLSGVLFSLWNNALVTDDQALQTTLRLVRTIAGS